MICNTEARNTHEAIIQVIVASHEVDDIRLHFLEHSTEAGIDANLEYAKERLGYAYKALRSASRQLINEAGETASITALSDWMASGNTYPFDDVRDARYAEKKAA